MGELAPHARLGEGVVGAQREEGPEVVLPGVDAVGQHQEQPVRGLALAVPGVGQPKRQWPRLLEDRSPEIVPPFRTESIAHRGPVRAAGPDRREQGPHPVRAGRSSAKAGRSQTSPARRSSGTSPRGRQPMATPTAPPRHHRGGAVRASFVVRQMTASTRLRPMEHPPRRSLLLPVAAVGTNMIASSPSTDVSSDPQPRPATPAGPRLVDGQQHASRPRRRDIGLGLPPCSPSTLPSRIPTSR